ncbi:hypothetical protein CBR_g81582 [Chara braunii]|uniref:CCHC-type domain-containing protein n=1 Tax=Chara braunii TaxID=69332 RepID=A0A388KAU4_CHABU|nr:hypothetical protein CBR_g81582 [Chara braunii]|eukprot:GBG67157.1 hypothetical protein CBR_g81582 [Chara braunii]
MKVAADPNGEWAKLKEEMQRRFKLGDGLLTKEDLDMLRRDEFSTMGAFAMTFEKMAKKVPGLAEEEQCVTFLGHFKNWEASSLTKKAAPRKKLTWAAIKEGVKEGELDQGSQGNQGGGHRQNQGWGRGRGNGGRGGNRRGNGGGNSSGRGNGGGNSSGGGNGDYNASGNQSSQDGGRGFGRGRIDWRNAICWHCGQKGHTIKFCHIRRNDEDEGLISTNYDGDMYDKFGYYIDPKIPRGSRKEALRRVEAGESSAPPAMFRIWQEEEVRPDKRVEEIGENEEVEHKRKVGTVKEEPIVVESDEEIERGYWNEARRTMEKMEDLVAKIRRGGLKQGSQRRYKRVDQKCRPVPALVTEEQEVYYDRERELIRQMRENAENGPCRINQETEEVLIIGEPDFLTAQERQLMVETMRGKHTAYAFNDDERGRLDVDKIPMIRIHTVPHEPWNLRGARYPNPADEEKVVNYLDGKIRSHVSDYSSGPYASLWFCFVKPNGTLRWVQDLQRLNAVTVRDAGGLPNADALSEACAGRSIISLIDWYSGYDQFPVYPSDRPMTATHTPRGLIHMNVAPQGWTNAVVTVQRHMVRAMQPVSPHITQPYIDVLAVQDLCKALDLLKEHNLTASGTKSMHCMRGATILGFVCDEKGRRSATKKTNKILKWPTPFETIIEARSFLGTYPTIARWLTYIWMFDFELERILGNKNRADGLSRVDWDKSNKGVIEDTPPVDGFLDKEEDVKLHSNSWSLAIGNYVTPERPIWLAPPGHVRRPDIVLKPYVEEDSWGMSGVEWMMELVLADKYQLREDLVTLETEPQQVEKHERSVGGMYLLADSLLQEEVARIEEERQDREENVIHEERQDREENVIHKGEDDDFEEGLEDALGSWATGSGAEELVSEHMAQTDDRTACPIPPEHPQQEVTSEATLIPSFVPSQGADKMGQKKFGRCFYCKKGKHPQETCPKSLKDEANGLFSWDPCGVRRDKYGNLILKTRDGIRAQLIRQLQEDMSDQG